MPRLDEVRKKERQIILSAAAKKTLMERFGITKSTMSRALRFIVNSKRDYEIRNAALNEYNGILMERKEWLR